MFTVVVRVFLMSFFECFTGGSPMGRHYTHTSIQSAQNCIRSIFVKLQSFGHFVIFIFFTVP